MYSLIKNKCSCGIFGGILALGFQHRMIPGGCSASKKNMNLQNVGTRFEWYFADCFRIEKYEPSTV